MKLNLVPSEAKVPPARRQQMIDEIVKYYQMDHDEAESFVDEHLNRKDESWGNGDLTVAVYYLESERKRDGALQISVHNKHRTPLRDHWRTLQAVKNEILGPEREALEVYPAESRLVDESFEYHLWVMPSDADVSHMPGFRSGRMVVPLDKQLADRRQYATGEFRPAPIGRRIDLYA